MVATQGLFLLNDDSVMDAAKATAESLLRETSNGAPDVRINRMFQLVVGTDATDLERIEFSAFIQEMAQQLSEDGSEAAEFRAWALACHALFASSRFQMLE